MAHDNSVRAARQSVRRVAAKARATLRQRGEDTPAPRDRADEIELIRRSGFFDQLWVEAQLNRRFDGLEDAIVAYLDAGPECSPHALFVWQWLDAKHGVGKRGTDPLVDYLRSERAQHRGPTHPLLHLTTILESRPDLANHEFGPVVGWLADHDDEAPLPTRPDDRPSTYASVRDAAVRADREWRRAMRFRNVLRISKVPPADILAPSAAWAPLSGPDGAPIVSIIMPMWNRAEVVRAAVQSVQQQTHQDWELVVVDDGSSDDSLAVVTGMAAFDHRIVPVAAPHRGVSAARNAGIERARGSYLAFLDTDNEWRPEFLQVMLHELETNQWEMGHAVLSGQRDGEQFFRGLEGAHGHLLVGNHVDLNVLVARTDLVRRVGGFDVTLRRGVDYDLVLKLAKRAALHLVPYIGVDYVDHATGSRITNDESVNWFSVITSRHLVDWDALSTSPRTGGLTSVVLLADSSIQRTVRWLRELGHGDHVEVVVVGHRLPRWQRLILACTADALGGGALVVVEAEVNTPALFNVGLGATTGDRVLLVPSEMEPDHRPLATLADALADPGVAVAQPLLLYRSGLVASAGAVFAGGSALPHPFLHEHPVSDTDDHRQLDVPGALGRAVGARTETLIAARGLDPLIGEHLAVTDFALKVHQQGAGRVVLCSAAQLTTGAPVLPEPAELGAPMALLHERYRTPPAESSECWRAAGFEPVLTATDMVGPVAELPDDRPLLRPRSVVRPLRTGSVTETPPALRWTIDLSAPAGVAGESWGDTHYGRALARSLRALGQHVSIDARQARHRPTRDLDDVILVLRGLDAVRPRPGCLNIEWVISHPDLVTADELAAFDLVYAASTTWSAETGARWGIDVRPLLQATDPSLFHPGRADFDTGDEVIFVGNSRGRHRAALRAARAAGARVTVHGRGWQEVLPADEVNSRLVDNMELGALYAAAGVVLNDHWEDMRVRGFVSNRLMDATASGARVISDSIPGLDLTATFHGLVQTFDDDQDMARILAQRGSLFPTDGERVAAAELVAAEHSFDARARVILDDALRLLARTA